MRNIALESPTTIWNRRRPWNYTIYRVNITADVTIRRCREIMHKPQYMTHSLGDFLLIFSRSAQPGHPSVGRRNEYQW